MDVVVNLNLNDRGDLETKQSQRYPGVPGAAMILSCAQSLTFVVDQSKSSKHLLSSPYISSAYLISTLKGNERTHQFTYNLYGGHLSHNTTYRNRPELHYYGWLQQLVNKPCISASNPSGPGGSWFNSEKADAKFIDDGVCYPRQYNNALVVRLVLRSSVTMPR